MAIENTCACRRGPSRTANFFGVGTDLVGVAVMILLFFAVRCTALLNKESKSTDEMEISYIHSCDDLPGHHNQFHDLVLIGQDIICEETKVIEVTPGEDEALFFGDPLIRTRGIRFAVRQGAGMYFGGAALTFERNEGETDAIFQVDGDLTLHADDPGYTRASLVTTSELDQHSIIRGGPASNVIAVEDSFVYFTDYSVSVVAEPSKALHNAIPDTSRSRTPTPYPSSRPSPKDSTQKQEPVHHRNYQRESSQDDNGPSLPSTEPSSLLAEGGADTSTTSDGDSESGTDPMPGPLGNINISNDLHDHDAAHTPQQHISARPQQPKQQPKQQPEQQQQQQQQQELHPRQQQLPRDGNAQPLHSTERSSSFSAVGVDQLTTFPNNANSDAKASIDPTYHDLTANPEPNPKAKRKHSTLAEMKGPPLLLVLGSCDEIPAQPTLVNGMIEVADDIICDTKRVIEISEALTVFSKKAGLATKGLYFHVREGATMRVGVETMIMEKFEGDSSPLLAVESGGLLHLEARGWVNLSEDATMVETNNLVRVADGAEFRVWGQFWHTESSITLRRTPLKKNPTWIKLNHSRNQWRYQHQRRQRQQQQQKQRVSKPAGHTTATRTPFSSVVSAENMAKYTFEERLKLNPAYIRVGDEIRFPAAMTSMVDGSALTLGADGSLLHATEHRQRLLYQQVAAEDAMVAKMTDTKTTTTAATSPVGFDYAEDDPRVQLRTLAAANFFKADEVALAHRPLAFTGAAAGQEEGSEEKDTRPPLRTTRAKYRQDFQTYLLRETSRIHDQLLARGSSTRQGTEKQDAIITPPSPPTIAGGGEDDGSGYRGETGKTAAAERIDSGSSGMKDEVQATAEGNVGQDRSSTDSGSGDGEADITTVTASTEWPPRYWGDDVALKVTEVGSVVVTIAGHIVLEKHDPRLDRRGGWLKRVLHKANPVRKVGDALRRHRQRRRNRSNNNDDDSHSSENDDDYSEPIFSTEYSLHVVEDGFEVRLEGGFVWGWYIDST